MNDDDTAAAPRYAANVPPSIKTPDSVDTRAGTLRFFDGLPDEDASPGWMCTLNYELTVARF